LTVAAPATLLSTFAWGGAANVIGSQSGAFVEGALKTESGGNYWQNYADAGGFYNGSSATNLTQGAVDFAIGGVFNAGFAQAQSTLSKNFFGISDPFAKPPINSNPIEFRYQPGGGYRMHQPPPIIDTSKPPLGASVTTEITKWMDSLFWDTANEFSDQSIDNWLDRKNYGTQ